MEKLEKNGDVNKFDGNGAKPLELQWEKKDRYKSLYVVYFTLFLQSLGLAIAMTGVWPYISKVILLVRLIDQLRTLVAFS